MRKGRFSEEQMVAIIREADRDPVAAVAKRHGISEQSIYTWRKRFGTFQADDVRRLKQLEAENARLREQIRRDVVELTLLASEKVTGKVLDEGDQRRLIDETIAEVDGRRVE